VAHASLARELALAEKYRRAKPGRRQQGQQEEQEQQRGGGEEGQQRDGGRGQGAKDGAVTISTIHAAKVRGWGYRQSNRQGPPV
jgi:hypothetical protein